MYLSEDFHGKTIVVLIMALSFLLQDNILTSFVQIQCYARENGVNFNEFFDNFKM